MATLQDFRNERLKKLEKLRALGVNPFPSKTDRTVKNSEVKLKFEEFESQNAVSYTHLRAHETVLDLVCRLLLDKNTQSNTIRQPVLASIY